MLTRLLPDQIANFWDIIKYAVEQSLPPIVGESPDKMDRILSACLSGKIQVWASYRREEEGTVFEGICLTKIIYDDASNTKNLLLYCIYGYESTLEEAWMHAFRAVSKYAKKHGCNDIVGYTNVDYLIEKAALFGGDAKYTFISFNINKTIKLMNDLGWS